MTRCGKDLSRGLEQKKKKSNLVKNVQVQTKRYLGAKRSYVSDLVQNKQNKNLVINELSSDLVERQAKFQFSVKCAEFRLGVKTSKYFHDGKTSQVPATHWYDSKTR